MIRKTRNLFSSNLLDTRVISSHPNFAPVCMTFTANKKDKYFRRKPLQLASLASGANNGLQPFQDKDSKKDDIYPHHPLSDTENF